MAGPDGDEERRREAQARLDRMRHEAGGALTGREARDRAGLDPDEAQDDPPLDWRMTPLNVTLQALAIAAFLAVVWFVVTAFTGGMGEVLSR